MSKKKRKLVNDPRRPQLFSNEEFGLPEAEYEYKVVVTTDKQGHKVRQRIPVRTKDSFIRAAREVWGDQNDYSESVLTGMKEPITVRCRRHDHYYTVPMAQNHIINPNGKVRPTGCPLCEAERTGYYPKNRGQHRFRTPEEKQREVEEKAHRKAEREAKREQRKAENLEELRRQRAIERYCRKGPDLVLTAPNAKRQPLTAREFYRRVSGRYGSKLTFQRKRKLTMQTKITATCYRHGPLTHDVRWWLDGKGCEYCTGQKVYYPLWKEYARQVYGDKYEYVGDAPAKGTDLIHYICKEHGLIEQRFDVHVSQGCGCPKCANYPNKKSPEQRCQEWIEKSNEKFRGEFDYSEAPADYVNNDSKVWLTHKPCGTRFQVTPDTHLRGVNGGCPICNVIFMESNGERTVRLWLEDHHIDHDLQHELPNKDPTLPLQYLKTDFWIDDFDGQPLVIEYNGEQHYEDVGHFYHDRVRNFEVQQHRDRYLRQYCTDHHLRLLEIPYWEFDHIDSILTSVLLNHEPIPTFEPPSTTDTQQAPTEA